MGASGRQSATFDSSLPIFTVPFTLLRLQKPRRNYHLMVILIAFVFMGRLLEDIQINLKSRSLSDLLTHTTCRFLVLRISMVS